MKPVIAGIMAITLGACSMVGIRSGTEQPDYTVIETLANDVEIRRYEPRLAAEVTVEGSEEEARSAGFRKLAAFIFGDNKTEQSIDMTAPVAQAAADADNGEKIAMTAPVAQEAADDGRWIIRFYMPSQYTTETLPAPTDPDIRITKLPDETFAVIRFSGSRSDDAVQRETGTLQATIEQSPWRAIGTAEAFFYDPPWTLPFLRRNEVAIPVEKSA